MVIIIFLVGLAMFFWGFYLYKDSSDGAARAVVGAIAAFFALCCIIPLSIRLYNIDYVNTEKVAYLRENNTEIETKLEAAIADFQTYELGAQSHFKPSPGSDVTVAVSMYPTLSSAPMVEGLIATYVANNTSIRNLELARRERVSTAFWLCLGLWGPPTPIISE